MFMSKREDMELNRKLHKGIYKQSGAWDCRWAKRSEIWKQNLPKTQMTMPSTGLNRTIRSYEVLTWLCLPLDQRSIWPLISNSQSIYILLRDSDIRTIMDTPEPKMPQSQPKATFFVSEHDLHLYQESRPPALICLSNDTCTGTIRTQWPALGLWLVDGMEPGIEERSLETDSVLERQWPYPYRLPGSMA